MTEWGNTISRPIGSGDPAADVRGPDRAAPRVPARHDDVCASDEHLLSAAARGDGEAFAELFHRHSRQLRATALRTIRDQTDAEGGEEPAAEAVTDDAEAGAGTEEQPA